MSSGTDPSFNVRDRRTCSSGGVLLADSETPCRYVFGGEAFSKEWTDGAYRLRKEGKIDATVKVQKGVTTENVSGPCPRCGHLFSSVTPASTPVVKGQRSVSPGQWNTVLVRCGCEESHTGRPDTQPRGCGARYNMSAKVVTG